MCLQLLNANKLSLADSQIPGISYVCKILYKLNQVRPFCAWYSLLRREWWGCITEPVSTKLTVPFNMNSHMDSIMPWSAWYRRPMTIAIMVSRIGVAGERVHYAAVPSRMPKHPLNSRMYTPQLWRPNEGIPGDRSHPSWDAHAADPASWLPHTNTGCPKSDIASFGLALPSKFHLLLCHSECAARDRLYTELAFSPHLPSRLCSTYIATTWRNGNENCFEKC